MSSTSLALAELHLVFGELELDFVRIIGDLQLRVQVILCILQPINQLLPGFVELQGNTSKPETSHWWCPQSLCGPGTSCWPFLGVCPTLPTPLTCLALFLASSRARPRSTERCTTFSQRDWTLTSRFLISTTSCFWLRNFSWFPV